MAKYFSRQVELSEPNVRLRKQKGGGRVGGDIENVPSQTYVVTKNNGSTIFFFSLLLIDFINRSLGSLLASGLEYYTNAGHHKYILASKMKILVW